MIRYSLTSILVFFSCYTSLHGQMSFTNLADSLGVLHQTTGSNFSGGTAIFDFNRDGMDDIVLGSGSGEHLEFYENTGSGFLLMDPVPIEDTSEAKQFLWVDYDNDGDHDFFLSTNMGGNRLFQNDGNMNFTDVTASAGLPVAVQPTWTISWADFDRDGWLDLYVCNYVFGSALNFTNYLYRNKGDGTFEDITQFSAVADSNKSPLATIFFDYNNDNWPDIFIAQDKQHGNVLLKNRGDGTFEDVSAASGADVPMDGMSAGCGDYDGNGYFDVYITNGPVGNTMMHNNGNGTFTNSAVASGTSMNRESWGASFGDFDNDTDLDLYVSSGAGGAAGASGCFVNQGNGTFTTPITAGLGGDTLFSYSNCIGDINNDGYADILSNNKAPDSTCLWINGGGTAKWIKVGLTGKVSNTQGVGCRIIAIANGKKIERYSQTGISFMGQNSAYQMIGLGTATVVDTLLVLWSSGHTDSLFNLATNQTYDITEGVSGIVMPEIRWIGSLQLCSGDSLMLYSGRYKNYSWTTGDSTQHIYITQAGTYGLTVIDSSNNSLIAATVTVTTVSVPQIGATQIMESCPGQSTGSASVTVQGPFQSILWSNGSVTNAIFSQGAGTYSVTVTDMNGCATTDSVDITEFLVQRPNLGADTSVCNSGILCFDATVQGAQSYSWSTGSVSPVLCISSAGTYDVVVIDQNMCSTMDTVVVSQEMIPATAFSTDTLLCPIISFNDNSQNNPTSWFWDFGDGNTSTMQNPSNDYSAGGNTSYTVTLISSNTCGADTVSGTLAINCSTGFNSTVGNSVQIYPNPSNGVFLIDAGSNFGQQIEISIIDMLGREQYSKIWNIDGGNSILEVAATELDAGIYILRLTDGKAIWSGSLMIRK